MAYTKIWIHLVWTTKKREKTLTKEIRPVIFDHIRQNAKDKGIYLDFINGYLEHIHCLITLKADQTVDKIIQLLKGESSYWYNNKFKGNHKIYWQDDCFAVSVSESQVNIVRDYIKNQEKHHAKVPFQKEYDELMRKYGFVKFSG